MNQKVNETAVADRTQAASKEPRDFVTGWRGVRYQVADVARSIEFYTQRLGWIAGIVSFFAFAGSLGLILLAIILFV